MALDRAGNVGDRVAPLSFIAGEKSGQLMGVVELGALTGVRGAFGSDEFEDEDRPLVVRSGNRAVA